MSEGHMPMHEPWIQIPYEGTPWTVCNVPLDDNFQQTLIIDGRHAREMQSK